MSTAHRRFGIYEIESLVGRGGMAEVFRARVVEGTNEGRRVAIKRLLPKLSNDKTYIEQFIRESELSQRLHHPNIVTVLEVGKLNETLFIAMEFVDGRDLAQILRRCRKQNIKLPIDFAVFLAKTLLEALAYAHDARDEEGRPLHVVHCDVSPSNLFISRTGEIKLGDFGVARARDTQALREIAGKPFYVSPELLDGEVTPAVDIWASAVTLYELLTLERPFSGETPEEVFASIRAAESIRIETLRDGVPIELVDVVEHALSPDPEARFSSAREFAAALEPHFDPQVGTPLAIAAVVRGLFGTVDE